MITKGESEGDNDEKRSIRIKDRINLLFNRYKQKQIRKTEVRDKLISIANSSGFIDNIHRKEAWNLIVDSPDYQYSTDEKQIQSHQYYEQIKLDVIRTLKRFPPNYSELERRDLQDELIVIITKVLIQHEELHYYQGYHDICLTFLLVLGEDRCLPIIDSITMSHLKYFMEPTMGKTRDSLSYLMPLINCVNSECAEHMERGGMGHVIFALPWFITWYSHVLDNLDIILRLYDLFLVSHYLMPIYVAAEIVNYHADEVLAKDCEMSSLHQYLSNVPIEIELNTWEEIIERALYLFERYPPETLDQLNQDWKIKCEYIEKSSHQPIVRSHTGKPNLPSKQQFNLISRVAFWGVTITVGGLAIYLWNQPESLDSIKFFKLGNFLG